MYKQIYKHLQNNGFRVFAIGQHTGVCKEPYAVIKERGQTPYLTSLIKQYIDIIVFFPLGNYSQMEEYVQMVEDCLNELKELKKTHIVTPAVIDDSVKAYSVSISYNITKKRR